MRRMEQNINAFDVSSQRKKTATLFDPSLDLHLMLLLEALQQTIRKERVRMEREGRLCSL